MKTTLVCLCVLLALEGCATVPTGTAPTTSPLISEDGTPRKYEVVGRGEGKAGHFALFGFIPLGRSDIDAAINNAVLPYQGDNLINVRYYVNYKNYFVGSMTSIIVEGDVIRYGDGSTATTPVVGSLRLPSGPGMFHRINAGSLKDGLSIEYVASQPLTEYLFLSFGVGYKRYDKTVTANNVFFPGPSELELEFDVFPIAVNLGFSAKEALSVPLNPYASAGVAYLPISLDLDDYMWDQVGFNLNVGADYGIIDNLGIGIDYKYFKSLTDFDVFNGRSLDGVTFTNLSFAIVFYP